ncbi:hypothetical protein V6N13_119294 [Hibiscus sabdariffa]
MVATSGKSPIRLKLSSIGVMQYVRHHTENNTNVSVKGFIEFHKAVRIKKTKTRENLCMMRLHILYKAFQDNISTICDDIHLVPIYGYCSSHGNQAKMSCRSQKDLAGYGNPETIGNFDVRHIQPMMQALPSPATYNAHHEKVLSAKFFCCIFQEKLHRQLSSPIRKKPFHGGFVASGQSQSLLKTTRLQKRKITYVRTEKEIFPSSTSSSFVIICLFQGQTILTPLEIMMLHHLPNDANITFRSCRQCLPWKSLDW